MTIPFVKMHGAGNDFVMIDDRSLSFPIAAETIARLANRPEGVGCEGVILVQPSTVADFSMRFFNPDGSEANLCGNGARCVAAFAFDIGAAKASQMTFETGAGLICAQVMNEGLVKIAMPQPKSLRHDFVNSGVPHAIVVLDDVASVDVNEEGRRIRYSDEFAPEGANVDFVKLLDTHSLVIRTYERGVEAETFACGTGSVAAALIGVAQYGLSFPVRVTTGRGVSLEIDGEWNGDDFKNITLCGPVKRVFSGTIDLTLCSN